MTKHPSSQAKNPFRSIVYERKSQRSLNRLKTGKYIDDDYYSELNLAVYLLLRATTLRAGLHRKYNPLGALECEIESLKNFLGGFDAPQPGKHLLHYGLHNDPLFDQLQKAIDAKNNGDEAGGWTIIQEVLKNKTEHLNKVQKSKAQTRRPGTPLDAQIKRILSLTPDITWRDLLDKLEGKAGAGVIVEITSEEIVYVGRKEGKEGRLAISSLPNKLTAIRKSLLH